METIIKSKKTWNYTHSRNPDLARGRRKMHLYPAGHDSSHMEHEQCLVRKEKSSCGNFQMSQRLAYKSIATCIELRLLFRNLSNIGALETLAPFARSKFFSSFQQFTSNNLPFGHPIICTDIYSQCYFVHWRLQQCFTQSSSLANQDTIFVSNC